MDYAEMVRDHKDRSADLTIGCIRSRWRRPASSGHGGRPGRPVVGFREKPETAAPLPDDPGRALGSMGIYVFNTRTLFELLCEDAAQVGSGHDFGKDIIPG
jgi:glucose-1-phosphate adenylyltransferase